MIDFRIDEERCIQCGECAADCPTGVIALDDYPKITDEDLAPALIDELLEVACHAPTGVNARGVLFTVVRERAVMQKLREEIMTNLAKLRASGQMPEGFVGQYLGYTLKAWQEEGKDVLFRGAPHLLVASAPKDCPCPVQDTHIALTTFQLMAHALGVGTLWEGIFMMALAQLPELPVRLGIPAEHIIGYAMAFGAPAMAYQRTVQRGPALMNVVQ